jgi:hypothetical protein
MLGLFLEVRACLVPTLCARLAAMRGIFEMRLLAVLGYKCCGSKARFFLLHKGALALPWLRTLHGVLRRGGPGGTRPDSRCFEQRLTLRVVARCNIVLFLRSWHDGRLGMVWRCWLGRGTRATFRFAKSRFPLARRVARH